MKKEKKKSVDNIVIQKLDLKKINDSFDMDR